MQNYIYKAFNSHRLTVSASISQPDEVVLEAIVQEETTIMKIAESEVDPQQSMTIVFKSISPGELFSAPSY